MDFSDLETHIDDIKTKPSKAKETWPCPHCLGSGKWRGGVNRHGNDKCGPCKGKGHFKTSPEQRAKSRKKAAERRAKQLEENVADFQMNHMDLWEAFEEHKSWNNFFNSMIDVVRKYGTLSEKQFAACYATLEKIEKKKAEREAKAVQLNFGQIKEKFLIAILKGIKRPKMRFHGFMITRAPDYGVNKDHLYVKTEYGTYLGKVAPNGNFIKSNDCTDEHIDKLTKIDEDVIGSAKAYGRVTGNCCCCGRELTKKESIELGIGPICAERFGL